MDEMTFRLAQMLAGDHGRASPNDIFARNQQFAKPAPQEGYFTRLDPNQEESFQRWVKDNSVPFDPSPQADYDMRGFYKGLSSGDPRAASGVNANDGRMHYTDHWKTPYHESFSAESKFALPTAPRWNEKDQLVTPDGRVIFDERAARRRN